MKKIENDDTTITHIYQWTDRCGIDLSQNGNGWTLTFYDDGDPVVIEYVPRWQMEHLRQVIEDELRTGNGIDSDGTFIDGD